MSNHKKRSRRWGWQPHLKHKILERLGLRDEPYFAIFLKEVDDPILDKQKFRLPLLVACSLSNHGQIIIPVSESVPRFIDEVFDELFKSRSQMFKDFVLRSKGIVYAKDLTTEEKKHILKCAAFVITTDKRVAKAALNKKLPYAYISQCENKEPEITLLNYETVENRCFKHSLIAALEA